MLDIGDSVSKFKQSNFFIGSVCNGLGTDINSDISLADRVDRLSCFRRILERRFSFKR